MDNTLDEKIKAAEDAYETKQKERFDAYEHLNDLINEEERLKSEVVKLKSMKHYESTIGKCYQGFSINDTTEGQLMFIHVGDSGTSEYFSIVYELSSFEVLSVHRYLYSKNIVKHNPVGDELSLRDRFGNYICSVDEISIDEYNRIRQSFLNQNMPNEVNNII